MKSFVATFAFFLLQFPLIVHAQSALSVTTTSLPTASVGIQYSVQLQATGGVTPYTWAISNGALTAGLTLSPGGLIAGTPTSGGAFNFTVTVTDSSSGATATTYGFDFRNTSGLVTDPSGYSPVLGESFPHTYGNGLSAGWAANGGNWCGIGQADRNSSVDARLAGINYCFNATTANDKNYTFNVTLPGTGSSTFCVAGGDATHTQIENLSMSDNGIVFKTIAAHLTVSSGSFVDANGNTWTASSFFANQVCITHTMTTTAFTLNMVASSDAHATVVAMLSITH
jgi:Putative Ig domain